MWKSVFLDDEFSRVLFKSAIQGNHVKLSSPNNLSEAQQLDSFLKTINSSRLGNEALLYCLLAEEVYVDPPGSIGWDIYNYGDVDLNAWNPEDDLHATEEEAEPYASDQGRPYIEHMSSDIKEFIKTTDAMRQFTKASSFTHDYQEFANKLSIMEPLIWKRFKRSHGQIHREDVRFAIDLIVANPNIIGERLSGEHEDFNNEVARTIAHYSQAHDLSTEELITISNLVYLVTTKADTVSCHIYEAERLNALYPVRNLTFGRSRNVARDAMAVRKHDDVIASVGIFLEEIKWMPVLNNIDDVIRLRQHPSFVEFRSMLANWTQALLSGNPGEEERMRKEVGKTNDALRRVATCSSAGRFFTYMGIPLMILDMFVAPVFGIPTTVAGFAIQGYADWLSRKSKWIMIGKSN